MSDVADIVSGKPLQKWMAANGRNLIALKGTNIDIETKE
jgi:hypothetical protein